MSISWQWQTGQVATNFDEWLAQAATPDHRTQAENAFTQGDLIRWLRAIGDQDAIDRVQKAVSFSALIPVPADDEIRHFPTPPENRSCLVPLRPYVTLSLLAATLVASLAGLLWISRQGLPLRPLGAVTGEDLLRGEWWRLLSNAFVHLSLVDLALSMLVVYIAGSVLERLWGHWRFLCFFLLIAVGDSCVALINHPHVVLVGGGGNALLGTVAWLLILIRSNPEIRPAKWMTITLLVILLLGGVSFLVAGGLSFVAQFLGAAVGALLATLVHYQKFGQRPIKTYSLVALFLVPALLIGGVLLVLQSR